MLVSKVFHNITLKYRKMKVFHFSRSYEAFEPPSLDLFSIGGPVVYLKNM